MRSLRVVAAVIVCVVAAGCAMRNDSPHVVANPDAHAIGHLTIAGEEAIPRNLEAICRAFQKQVDPQAALDGTGSSTAGEQQAAFVAIVGHGNSPWSARPTELPLATCDYRATTVAALSGLQVIQRGGSYFTGEALIDDRGEWTSNPGLSLDD